MKKPVLIVFSLLLMTSCKNNSEINDNEQMEVNEKFAESDTLIGEEFSAENILTANQMAQRYQDLRPGDTIEVKFSANVNEVCKNKGCWMKLDLTQAKEAMVKFKDYSFFVPKDIEQNEVIISGKAYVAEMSVEEQRHFAEDAGKDPEEVAAIVNPKRTLSFLAEGVVIKENQ